MLLVETRGAAEVRSLTQTTESWWIEILYSDLELPRWQKFIIITDCNYPDIGYDGLTSICNSSGTDLI